MVDMPEIWQIHVCYNVLFASFCLLQVQEKTACSLCQIANVATLITIHVHVRHYKIAVPCLNTI